MTKRYTPNAIANEIMAEDAWHDSLWVCEADYASAVRTLQKMADHGGTRYGGDHMEEMAKETLIQLGEPIEPEGM